MTGHIWWSRNPPLAHMTGNWRFIIVVIVIPTHLKLTNQNQRILRHVFPILKATKSMKQKTNVEIPNSYPQIDQSPPLARIAYDVFAMYFNRAKVLSRVLYHCLRKIIQLHMDAACRSDHRNCLLSNIIEATYRVSAMVNYRRMSW